MKLETSPAAPGVDVTTGKQAQIALTSFLNLYSLVGIGFYGPPFFYDFMVREFGWSRTTVTSGNAFGKLIVLPLFGFIAGYIIDRFGPRRLMMAGILMGAASIAGLGMMSMLWVFYLCFIFNALGYVGGGPLPNQALISRWFDKSRGKAMGFAYLGIGIGGAITQKIAAWLTGIYGWHWALIVLGIAMFALAMPLTAMVTDAPENFTRQQSAQPMTPVNQIVKSLPFILLAIGSMCSIGAVGATNQNLKLYLSLDKGFSQGDAANVISLVLTASIIGRLLMGWLADRFPKKYVMLLIYLLVASGIPLLFWADQSGVIYLFAIIFGIGVGGDYMIIPLMAADLFGVKVLGRVMGIILIADGLAESLMPMLVAKLRDQGATYRTGFLLLIALAASGAAAIAMLPQKSKEPSYRI
jgi:sugar phosphate permease